MHESNDRPQIFKIGDPVTLKQLARAQIRYWLEETGSVKESAKILGLHRGALSRKISREKIPWTKNASRSRGVD